MPVPFPRRRVDRLAGTDLLDRAAARLRQPAPLGDAQRLPRFTIITGIPYDRARTTMVDFEMCSDCRAEYEDPLNRRFHAEPVACDVCGPQLSLLDVKSAPFEFAGARDANLIDIARHLLLEGKILAIKGIGGFHLACDALNHDCGRSTEKTKIPRRQTLRVDGRGGGCHPRALRGFSEEEELLLSERRPIVLLKKKPDRQSFLKRWRRAQAILVSCCRIHRFIICF